MKRLLLGIIVLLAMSPKSYAEKNWSEEINKSITEAQDIWKDAIKIIDDIDGPHYLVGKWSIRQDAPDKGYPALIQLFDNKKAFVGDRQCMWKVLLHDMPWYLKLIHKENLIAEASIPDYKAYVIAIRCEGMESLYAYNKVSRLFVDYDYFESVDFKNYDKSFNDQIADFLDRLMTGQKEWRKKVADQYTACVDANDLQYYPESDAYAQSLKIKQCGRQYYNYCEAFPTSVDCQRRVYVGYDRQGVRSRQTEETTKSPLKKWGGN